MTVIALGIYKLLYASSGPIGLAIASDIGIVIQTLTLAVLLHRRRMVSIAGLDFPELLRALLASAVSYVGLVLLHRAWHTHGRLLEMVLLLVASVVWLALSAAVLLATGSSLPRQLGGRFLKKRVA